MSTVAVVIPAAGNSTRFGGPHKKPFVQLDGRPVWQQTCQLFWNRPDVASVFLVVSPGDLDEFRGRHGPALALANVTLVAGGAERFESVANALAAVPPDVDLIAVHDAVRPLTPPALIDAVFAAAAESGAALLAVPLADTLKRVPVGSDRVTETVPRAGLWQAQTPQVFRRDWLVDAYGRRANLGPAITDDAQLVEAANYPVRVVVGSPDNFKITTADDLKLAEAVLASRVVRETPKTTRPFDYEERW